MIEFISTTVYVDGVKVESSSPAAAARRPYIAGGVTIRWGRESTLTTSDTETLSLSIRKPRHELNTNIAVGKAIRVTCLLAGQTAEYTAFLGVIDTVTAGVRDASGWHDVQIAATCYKGQKARERIGSKPWPARACWKNMAAITAESPGIDYSELKSVCVSLEKWGADCIALDVDSRSPLELAELIAPIHSKEVVMTSSGLKCLKRPWSGVQTQIGRTRTSGTEVSGTISTIAPGQFVVISADAIEDAPCENSFDSSLASITETFHLQSTGKPEFQRESSKTWGGKNPSGANVRIETLYRSSPDNVVPNTKLTQEQFDKMVGAPPDDGVNSWALYDFAPRVNTRLGPIDLRVSQLDWHPFKRFVNLDDRWGTTIAINDGPTDVPAAHYVIGAEVTLSGDINDTTIRLDLEPATFGRPPATTFAQVPKTPDLPRTWAGWRDTIYNSGPAYYQLATQLNVQTY